tara:strand:- start:2559 stop:3077 length:519 start_codon:yes stop_codon:yes gene_type:complete
MKKISVIYGLIGGIIVSAFMALTIPNMDADTDMTLSMFMGFASMIVALSTVFLGIKKYRDVYLNGVISFGKAFLIGLYISLIASTMYVLTWMVISDLYMPNFMENYVEAQLNAFEQTAATAKEISQKREELNAMAESYKNPVIKALYTYMEIFPVGLIITLISSLILKRKPS